MIKKTKTGFPSEVFKVFSADFKIISSPRPCEICKNISILKNMIEETFVCYACWRRDYDEKIAENERVVNKFNIKRDLLLNTHSHLN